MKQIKTIQDAKHLVLNLSTVFEPERSKLISVFQKFIAKYQPPKSEEALCEILDGLAMDLDYYASSPEWRKKDASFYGEEKLVQNIQEVLQTIKQLEDKGVIS